MIKSPTTALAVGIWPAPGPTSITSPTACPLMNIALLAPSTDASRVMTGHEHRMRANIKAARAAPRQPYHLDAIAELARHRDVKIGDVRDALPVDSIRVNKAAKRERGENGYLVGDIEPFNIVGRIGLGESKSLRSGRASSKLCPRSSIAVRI